LHVRIHNGDLRAFSPAAMSPIARSLTASLRHGVRNTGFPQGSFENSQIGAVPTAGIAIDAAASF